MDLSFGVPYDACQGAVSLVHGMQSMACTRRSAVFLSFRRAHRCPVPRGAGLLFPSFNVHAEHEEPQPQRVSFALGSARQSLRSLPTTRGSVSLTIWTAKVTPIVTSVTISLEVRS